MNISGKAWCPNCAKDQPASLVGLSINGSEKTVTGFCSVCEHPVQRTFTFEPKRKIQHKNSDEDNCVPLHSNIEKQSPPEKEKVEKSSEVEQPSWVALVAIFSVCLVITYLL